MILAHLIATHGDFTTCVYRAKNFEDHSSILKTNGIYDGSFKAKGMNRTIRAVNEGNYFTESSGLVAVHPVADALADEVPYFAWLLRFEAFQRYGFDPDGVFSRKVNVQTT
ncbi:MAG: hypothetical protein IT426_14475 [Pirellulales bacterium]|nr:hypothetical protein [Pirellulales bacterium]